VSDQPRTAGSRLFDVLASLRLTVALLLLSILLVLLGTLEQVHWGVWHVAEEYFESWVCFYPMDPTAAARLPIPGGFLLGALLLTNLTFAHFRHFRSGWKHVGVAMTHGGLLLLLAGGFVTAVYQQESAMIIPEGESRDYSEAFREYELAFVEKRKGAKDAVIAIPDGLLRRTLGASEKDASRDIILEGTPFSLFVTEYLPNARLRAASQQQEGRSARTTHGLGKQFELTYLPQKESYDDNNPNMPLALVEVREGAKAVASFVLGAGLTESFPPQALAHAGRDFELSLRRARSYHPFTVSLQKFTHEKYPGTETPKRFASDVTVKEEGGSEFSYHISMNNPLRHAGLTFFQSSFGRTKDGVDQTVLQVVRNPGAWIPYASVSIMSLGLLWQFGRALISFLISRSAKATAAAAALCLAVTSAEAASVDTAKLGEVPVQSGGRVVPIETLASGSLLQMRSRREVRLSPTEAAAFGKKPSTWTAEEKAEIARELPGVDAKVQESLEKRPVNVTRGSVKSVDWLIEVAFRPHVARHLPTFRIEHPVVLKIVGRDAEKGLFATWDDVLRNSEKLTAAAAKARSRPQADRDAEDRALVQLELAARQYAALSMTFAPGDLPADIAPQREYDAWVSSLSRAIAEMNANKEKGGSGTAFDPKLQETVKSFVERYQEFASQGVIGIVPPKDPVKDTRWDNLGASLLAVVQDRDKHRNGLGADGVLTRYASFAAGWREGNDDQCASQISALSASLRGPWSEKTDAEAGFGRLQPFYWLLIAYFLVGALVLGHWLTGHPRLRTAATAAGWALFVLHTGALLYRMWLHGRPPVTNLYSSAVFVAWGAVLLGLVVERAWRNGIGACAAAVSGFLSLIVAHNLGLSGEDNLESVRAVLDSNFWLSTHVTIVTLGYSATFVAGLLGALHLVLRAAQPGYAAGDAVARAAYGILAFATLASFVGTMLGGIWADQSWGRFWGWDPKENGAILIVLWCAVCLHARWGGLVRREGLMQLLVLGNIVTAWSWFGTNLLGVGLHSYGFTEQGAFWLYVVFIPSQLLLAALGWLPARSPKQTLSA
jgi:ABC-type transport system involved in cytochrome c biogenesis permease subunit